MKKSTANVFWIGLIIGLGLLASLDGIVSDYYLQRYQIIESPNLKLETISDKVFNSLLAMLCFWGGIKFYKDVRTNGLYVNWKIFLGAILMGGGTFNMIEGIVNHLILKIHHVMPGSPHEILYDLLFILVGALLLIVGLLIAGILNDIAINREPEKASK